jgi:hypothetical protein
MVADLGDLVFLSHGAVAAERWDHWLIGGLYHATLRLRSGPREDLVAALLTADGIGTTVALAVRRDPAAGPELTVRLSERSLAALDAATGKLIAKLAALGVTVDRLDGRQAYGLAATLPLGGFVP